jgi:hypothetical protein
MDSIKRLGIGLMILIVSLFCILYGSSYITGFNQPVQKEELNYEMNSSQLEIANRLWESNLTAEEFFEKTNPEFLRTMPQEMKQFLHEKKMIWPKPR